MKLLYSGCSRIGKVRSMNEDAILMQHNESGALFLVADGMGGLRYGNVVSQMICKGYADWWETRFLTAANRMSFPQALKEIKDVLLRLNQEIIRCFGERTAGSTLVLLFLFRENCLYLSAGDSRIYLARRFTCEQITIDDIYENLEKTQQIFGSGANGKLVNAIGIHPIPEFRIRTDAVKRGDRFFLCSDGVYRYLTFRNFKRKLLFRWPSPYKLVDRFSQEVEQNGAKDNYSMIYVRVKSP